MEEKKLAKKRTLKDCLIELLGGYTREDYFKMENKCHIRSSALETIYANCKKDGDRELLNECGFFEYGKENEVATYIEAKQNQVIKMAFDIKDLTEKLEKASKNDHRDGNGRFTKTKMVPLRELQKERKKAKAKASELEGEK